MRSRAALWQQQVTEGVRWIKRKLHRVYHTRWALLTSKALLLLHLKLPLVGAAQHVGCQVIWTSDGNTETKQTMKSHVKAFLH